MLLTFKRVIEKHRRKFTNLLYFCTFLRMTLTCDSDGSNCPVIAGDDLVLFATRLDGFTFWSNTVSDIGSCARCCVKLAKCQSFNFHVKRSFCELNSDTLSHQPASGETAPGTVYSNIADWPQRIDPACYGHNCTEDETCVPGVLALAIGLPECTSGCKYGCMRFTVRKCPVLESAPGGRVPVSRATGSIAVCPKGYVGEPATCQSNQIWSQEEPCQVLYNTTCTNSTVCEEIEGVCENNKCTCSQGMVYSASELKCMPGCAVFGTSCYTFHENSVNWTDAQSSCNAEGGYLLALGSQQEFEFIKETVDEMNPSGPYWWTGGNDIAQTGNFIWANSGQQLSATYENWTIDTGPSLSSAYKRCVTLYKNSAYRFKDKKCHELRPFVCEKPNT